MEGIKLYQILNKLSKEIIAINSIKIVSKA